MSISQNFPNTRPSLNLNFARSKTLDPRITFTRTSTGTYVDESGVIKYAATDEPRFDHDPATGECLGLLVEEERSNIIPYSIVSSLTWSNTDTVTNNVTISPDGTNTAARIQVGAGYVADLSIPVSAGTTYTFSFWLKSVSGSGTWGINIYDHSGANIGHHRTTVNITEEWQRVSYTYTPTGTLVNVYVSDDRDNLATISDGYVWGAQLEAGSFMTSLIPTSGGTATRNPDNASITGTNFSSWYNQSDGTIYCKINITRTLTSAGSGFWTLDNGNFARGITAYSSSSPNFRIAARDEFSQGSIGDIPLTNVNEMKSASKILQSSNNEIISSVNGSFTGSSTYSINVNINRLLIGLNNIIGNPVNNYLNGTISQLTYYPVRLPNTTLQTLTK